MQSGSSKPCLLGSTVSGCALWKNPLPLPLQKDNQTFPIYLHETSIHKVLGINVADLSHPPAVGLEAEEDCNGFAASTFLCSHLPLQLEEVGQVPLP